MDGVHPTKQRLLDVGLAMLLEHGYNSLGVQTLLDAAGVPKGSFYHHFADKEDFALCVVDQYMEAVHAALDECLADPTEPPLRRLRSFFETTRQAYKEQGYLGCLLGGLGQELSGVNDVFRRKISTCLRTITRRVAVCLEEAGEAGDLAPATEPRVLASLLVDCWEGAALRSRLHGNAKPLNAMLDFYFGSVGAS